MQSKELPALTVVDGHKSVGDPLSYLAAIRSALLEAKTLEETIHWRSKAKAIEEIAKTANAALDVKLEASELRLRWERKLGEAIAAAPKNRGTKDQLLGGSCKNPPRKPTSDPTPTLEEMGVGKSLADRARKLAAIPQNEFEEILEETKGEAVERPDKALSAAQVIRSHREGTRPTTEPEHSSIIKPMDNWNFSNVVYGRINVEGEREEWGYIPGELYANCLWYWTKDGDKVVAPMAGSGQILKVWGDRDTWMRPEKWDISLTCYDLTPRGPYKERIGQNDLTLDLPESDVDYIVMDVPYFGMVVEQYSDKVTDLANALDPVQWIEFMRAVASNCFTAQSKNGLCTVITPNFRDLTTKNVFMAANATVEVFASVGYQLIDKAYSSRRIQQAQNPNMARTNKQAKERRIMLTDIAEVLTFST